MSPSRGAGAPDASPSRPAASLRARTLGAVLAVVLPLVLAFGIAGTSAAARALEEEKVRTLTAVATTLAAQWEGAGEAGRVARLTPDSRATRERLQASLRDTRDATGVRRLRVASAEHATLLDTDDADPFATAFDLAQDRATLAELFADGRPGRSTLFDDADGIPHLRAYAPLRDGDTVVAALAVEGDLAHLHLLRRLRAGLLAVILLTLAAVSGAVLWATGRVSRPLRRLVRAARRIGAGDLREPIAPATSDDEVGALARAMEQMRADLARRDEQMQLMLGGIAHEIRNPLGGLRLTADLLDETGAPDADDAARRLRRDVAHLERVTEEFLAFARPRPLRRTPVDVGDLARIACEACAPLAAQRGVTLATHLDPLVLSVDAEQLRGALTNLVRNAIEASPAGAPVDVAVLSDADGARIEIADRGPGLDPAVRDRLFEPFVTTRQQGSGLGLPLVRRVLDAHGGTVRLEDRDGGGTRAVVTLPPTEIAGAHPKGRAAPTVESSARVESSSLPAEDTSPPAESTGAGADTSLTSADASRRDVAGDDDFLIG